MNRGKEGRRGKKEDERQELHTVEKREEREKEGRYICTMHTLATMYVRQSVPGRMAENSGHVGPCEAF